MSTEAVRVFLPTLRKLERDLAVPLPQRLRILRELEFDLEGLRHQFEARGIPAEQARVRALEALVPNGATLRQLDQLHSPLYRRATRHYRDDRLRFLERFALVLATTAVLFGETFVLLQADLLPSRSSFLWLVLGFGSVLFATVLAKVFQLWVKRDYGNAARGLTAIPVLAGCTVMVGIVGMVIDFVRLAARLEAVPELAGTLFLDWLIRDCALLAFSILLALAGGLAWFVLAQWLTLVTGARSELLGLHENLQRGTRP